MTDTGEEYDVEAILDVRERDSKTEYLVKWKGFVVDDATCEPKENLSCQKALDKFHNSSSVRFLFSFCS